MLKLSNVTLAYNKRPILRNINLTCRPGTITAIIGSNGTGKSTLLKACAGLLAITSGNLQRQTTEIGFAPEQCALPPWLSAYNALWYATQFAQKKVTSVEILNALERVNLHNYAQHKIETFSKGMKQRLAFAEILLCNPPLILLDEPFSGLDIESTKIIDQLLYGYKEQQKTVLCSAHSADEFDADVYIDLSQSSEL